MDYQKYIAYTKEFYGLNKKEVLDRTNDGLNNKIEKIAKKSNLSIILENVFSYFNFIFSILAIMLIIVGSIKDLTFLPVIIINTFIGIIQRLKAKKTLDKLKLLHSIKALVIREGTLSEIATEDIVKDDIVIFRTGEQLYADAIVLSGDILVNEALITGEADDIKKVPQDELLSGSFITSGNAVAKITVVGKDSYANRIIMNIDNINEKRTSKMMHSIDNIILVAGISIIPIGAIMLFQQLIIKKEVLNIAVPSMVAALVGMIPEGLYLLASITLAISCIILAKKNILVQEMRCLENLARIDILCVDKTGTITDENMICDSALKSDSYDHNLPDIDILLGVISKALPHDNPTINALYEKFKNYNDENIKVIKIEPFTSKTKYSRILLNIGDFKIGAAEILLKNDLQKYMFNIEEYAAKGNRVLAFTRNDNEYLGLILLSNKIRVGVSKIFEYFKNNNVQIKVISGDSPSTVSYIAGKVNIENSDKYVDMSKINEKNLSKLALSNTIFGRTTPFQKKELIKAMQMNGKTVAFVGDGVNDILALNTANCSIAMFSGASAACNVSDMVLLNSDFSDVPYIVREGRRVVNNIERSAGLFLYKNIFSLFLAILSLISVKTYPLFPSQMAFVGAFTIGIPAFLLSRESNYRIIKGNFIFNVLKNAFVPAITAFFMIGSLLILNKNWSIDAITLSIIATCIYSVVGFAFIFDLSIPFNKYRIFIFSTCFITMLVISIFFGKFFGIVGISTKYIIMTIIYVAITLILYIFLKFTFNNIKILYKNIKKIK